MAKVIIINYHRIGKYSPNNPLSLLHSVTKQTFKRQIRLINSLGTIVSLDKIYEVKNGIYFIITFDDVSNTIFEIKSFLENKNIPYTIAPSCETTSTGFAIRDKVYFLIQNHDKKDLFRYTKDLYPDIIEGDFSFYKFTKSSDINNVELENNLINPLFNIICTKTNSFERAYLSWEEIKTNFKNHPLVTICNHGFKHYNYSSLSEDQLENDINISFSTFREKLDFSPNHFSVPFGGNKDKLEPLIKKYLPGNIKTILWVDQNEINIDQFSDRPISLYRVQAMDSFYGFVRQIFKLIKT